MAKRRTREELRAEFIRMLDIWTHVRSFLLLQMQDIDGMDPDQDLPTSDALLDKFDNGPGTSSQHLCGLQQALNNWLVGLPNALKHGEATATAFLARYTSASGRDFFDDMGDPKRKLQMIMNRGQLQDEDDYHLLKNALDDAPDILPAKDIHRANDLLGSYESQKRGTP
ncbi:hypothetical protein [Parasedimentitalea huanghaiensis]|uniref:Uncharacterized protein n=1 Tax=Parasedimentitalea huanghaiensis TaxID=2682100 RepID=A0A6L6WDS6_9RHOB|nr:hypothetical protein [Zongyanglinia huanghaiensis]MVO15079.1 hypothetical protein [Zongyanglinia huanghaiensis]